MQTAVFLPDRPAERLVNHREMAAGNFARLAQQPGTGALTHFVKVRKTAGGARDQLTPSRGFQGNAEDSHLS